MGRQVCRHLMGLTLLMSHSSPTNAAPLVDRAISPYDNSQSQGHKNLTPDIIAGVALGSFILFLIMVLACWIAFITRRQGKAKVGSGYTQVILLQNPPSDSDSDSIAAESPPAYKARGSTTRSTEEDRGQELVGNTPLPPSYPEAIHSELAKVKEAVEEGSFDDNLTENKS